MCDVIPNSLEIHLSTALRTIVTLVSPRQPHEALLAVFGNPNDLRIVTSNCGRHLTEAAVNRFGSQCTEVYYALLSLLFDGIFCPYHREATPRNLRAVFGPG